MSDLEHAGLSRYSLRGDIAFKDDGGGYMLASQTIPYIEQLRARIAELEADKERLDWVESERRTAKAIKGAGIGEWKLLGWTASDSYAPKLHDTLRQAIDAEREEK